VFEEWKDFQNWWLRHFARLNADTMITSMLFERCMPKEENLKLQVEVFALETSNQANKAV